MNSFQTFINILKIIIHLPANLVLFFIKIYQKTLSPDHSFWSKFIYPFGYCKFTPSCSEYARAVIHRQGIIRGGLRALWRVVRCNPWSSGGDDLP
jgi:putative membrane protein insertion efficiency factor